MSNSELAAALNEVQNIVGHTEEQKGFREDWFDADRLEFLANHEWSQGKSILFRGAYFQVDHELLRIANVLRTNIMGTKLMLAVTELAEAMESLRDTSANGVLNGEGNLPEEMADTVIRLMSFSDLIRAKLGNSIMDKAEINAQRPHKHGRNI